MRRLLLVGMLSLLPLMSASGWRILYKEQYYRLYHEQLYRSPDDTMESIRYLEEARKADFANPLYALARIATDVEWERYRYLFNLHVDLLLIRLHLTLGSKWDKQVAHFYNAPWKRQNLQSIEEAERIYRYANTYWQDAVRWSTLAWELRTTYLEDVQEWMDENWRIETGDLDYPQIIDLQLARLAEVRAEFEAMDAGTY